MNMLPSVTPAILMIIAALVIGVVVGVFSTILIMKKANVKNDKADDNSEKTDSKSNVQIANPVAGMSAEEAIEIALGLGEGKDMGTWKTMSAEEFLKWWKESNK